MRKKAFEEILVGHKTDRFASLEEAHSALYKTLDYTGKVFGALNIPWFLMWGSFLGAIREKGIIPWDDDIDIGVSKKDYQRLLELSRSSFSLQGLNIHSYLNTKGLPTNEIRVSLPGFYRVIRSNFHDYISPLCVDVFWYEKAADKLGQDDQIKQLRTIDKWLRLKGSHYKARTKKRYFLRRALGALLCWKTETGLHKKYAIVSSPKRVSNSIWFPATAYSNDIHLFAEGAFDELIVVPFGPTQAFAPANKNLLKTMYGPNWGVPHDRSNGATTQETFLFREDLAV